MAVVDDQRGPAMAFQVVDDLQRVSSRAPLVNRTDGCMTDGIRQRLVEMHRRYRIDREAEPVIFVNRDDAFVPALFATHRMVDRQRIEEFVRQEDRGACGNFSHIAMPGDRHAGGAERLALFRRQHTAHFDQMHRDCGAKRRQRLGGAQRIRHQRAAAGAELDQIDACGRTHLPPHRRGPRADSSPNIWLISGAVMKSPGRRTDRAT